MSTNTFDQLAQNLEGFITRSDAKHKSLEQRLDGLEVSRTRPPSGGLGGGSDLVTELKGIGDLAGLVGGGRRGGCKFTLRPETSERLLAGMYQKTVTRATLGWPTEGVMPTERDRGITLAARPRLHMRNVLPSRPTTMGEIYWVTESVRPTRASPVVEAESKPLTDYTLTANSERVETIAICHRASKQSLDDYDELGSFIGSELAGRVREEEDLQILSGSGTSPNLHGLVTQGQAWDLSLLTASDGYEYSDIIAGAMQQIAEDNELGAGQFVVLHPGDAWRIRRLKDSVGRYIFGDPNSVNPLVLWGAPVVETSQMSKGTFLVGSSDPAAAEVRERMAVTVEISTEDGDNFRQNLVTYRAEMRLVLVVKRPNAFVQGSLTQSPI